MLASVSSAQQPGRFRGRRCSVSVSPHATLPGARSLHLDGTSRHPLRDERAADPVRSIAHVMSAHTRSRECPKNHRAAARSGIDKPEAGDERSTFSRGSSDACFGRAHHVALDQNLDLRIVRRRPSPPHASRRTSMRYARNGIRSGSGL